MRDSMILCTVAIFGGFVSRRERQPTPAGPDQLVIGRHTFIDVGPPNDFDELLRVGPNAIGASIERITLTPAGDTCLLPAQVETTSRSIGESPATLLGMTNPCTIPGKELRSELKRCTNCPVFSGAEVAMQVQCGVEMRILRSNILDTDIFDPKPNMPKHTSWTVQLLGRLDQAIGPGGTDKPIIPIFERERPPVQDEARFTLRNLRSGKYDIWFHDAPDKPSSVYRAAQIHPTPPSVRSQISAPFQPTTTQPPYPAVARAAQVEGAVSFKIELDANGGFSDLAFDSGPSLLRGTVKNAVSGWRFTEEAFGQQIRATIDFALNCPPHERLSPEEIG